MGPESEFTCRGDQRSPQSLVAKSDPGQHWHEGLEEAATGEPAGPRPATPSMLQVPPGYNYRAEVRTLLPQLQVLDDVPATRTSVPAPRKLDQDWLMVKEAIKEGSVSDSLFPGLGMAATHPPSGKGCPTQPGA